MAKKEKVKVPKSVLALRKSPEHFAKKHDIRLKGHGMSKKDKKHAHKRLKKEYSEYAVDALNKAVKILAENPEGGKKIDKVREGVDYVISNPAVMDRVAKLYQKDPDRYPHMIYLPNMIMNTIQFYRRDDLTDDEKKIAESMDTEALVQFCEKILKKQIKRYQEQGLSRGAACSIATVIPTAKILKNRTWYRQLINKMYELAEVDDVDVDMILRAICKLDKRKVISRGDLQYHFYQEFMLTKASNKTHQFNESQKDLHEALIEKTIQYLDSLKPRKIREILSTYIKRRKRAEEYKNDTRRVIKFVDYAHSNTSYVNIKQAVLELIEENSANEVYLG